MEPKISLLRFRTLFDLKMALKPKTSLGSVEALAEGNSEWDNLNDLKSLLFNMGVKELCHHIVIESDGTRHKATDWVASFLE